jgi:hypothetical protein
LNNGYDSNVVLLMAPDRTPSKGLTYCPAVAKWTAENVMITMRARAKRAIYMKSCQEVGQLPWRIRDTTLINCWFAGASLQGETVRAENASGLHVIGGLFSSGLGLVHPKNPSLPPLRIAPGIVLGGTKGCANTHLNGVDLTHGIIKIETKSLFINIDCRFGKLLIYNGPGKKHIDLQVSKRYVLNPRTNTPDYLDCANAPNGYKCYNNAQEIENDTDADWMHVEEPPIT